MSKPKLLSALFTLTAILCLMLVKIPAAQGAPAPEAAIDGYIQEQMQAARIPGMALAIVKDGQVVHTRGFGTADGGGRPTTPQTPFILGSTSKSFTAMAIWQLIEAGKVSLDAPVRQYLPWFDLADHEAAARLTVRQLLNQTSGLDQQASFGLKRDESTSLEAVVRQLASVKPSAAPGERFQYANINYTTLGLIIEAVSGQSYATYVQGHIFEPLGMKHAYAALAPAQQDGLAAGHQYLFGYPIARSFPFHPSDLPAGFLIASAEDMGRYLLAAMNGGPVLSRQSLEAMQAPAAPMGAPMAPDSAYAMGWWRQSMAGVPVIAHAGDVPNYQSWMVFAADRSWGVVLLSNANNALFPQLPRITEGVVSLMVGQEPPAAPGPSAGLIMLLVCGGLVLVVLRQLWTLYRIGNELVAGRLVRRWWRIAGNVGLGLALLVGFPVLTHQSWDLLVDFAPDLAWLLILVGGLSLVLAWSRLILPRAPKRVVGAA